MVQSQQFPAPMSMVSTIPDEFPTFHHTQQGLVYRLLDDNFGLLRVSNSLALFDVCDFWTRPTSTASKDGKHLSQVVQVDTIVKFHATLLDRNAKVQYLASSVWLASDPLFDSTVTAQMPAPIPREKIHVDKVNIYQTVLKSISSSLPNLKAVAQKDPFQMMTDSDVEIGLTGTIVLNFVDGQNKMLGGLMKVDDKVGLCFFTLSTSKLPNQLLKVTVVNIL